MEERLRLCYYNAPCKNCQKRHLNCHSTCKDYLDFKKKNEEFKKQKREEQQERSYYYKLCNRHSRKG